jgi:O-antigen ligase
MMDDRLNTLLRYIVEEYVATSQPVSSQALVDNYDLDVSPATVRNWFAELDQLGMTAQPHTAGGRVPTEEGFKHYVSTQVAPRPAGKKIRERLEDAARVNREQRLRAVVRELAELSGLAAVVSGDDTYYTGLSRLFNQSEFQDQSQVVGLTHILGYLHHNSVTNIFFDSNGYSFLLYYLIWYPLIKDIEWKKIAALFLASSLIISAKTLIIFHIFTHIYDWANIGFLYLWVRDTKVGELTLVTANYWRVFFQSQIYPAAIWLMTIVTMMLVPKIRWSWKMVALSALMFSSVLISLSRSFWLALILTAVIVTLTYIKTIWQQQQKKLRLGLMLTSIILGAGIVAATLFIPPVDSELANAFANRFNNGESAASSRANLAPVMIAGIKQHWLLGSGLGSTLTYKNNDPRIRSMVGPDGSYTTYAFELGWLDFWFKFGLLGLLSWLALIGYALYRGWRLSQRQTGKTAAIISLFAGLTFIAITHAVTPYLNHPLGISYLILCLLFIQYHESQTPSHH